MHAADLAGQLPALFDPTTGQNVGAMLQGRFTFATNGDPNAVRPHLQSALLRATHQVVSQKLAQKQIALASLAQSLPYLSQEIIQASGAQQMGAAIQELQIGIQLQGAAQNGAAPPQGYGAPGLGGPQPPMHGQFMNPQPAAKPAKGPLDNIEIKASIDIGGFRIKGSSSKGLDEAGLARQVEDKVRTEITWWIIGGVVALIVVVGVIGFGLYIWHSVKTSSDPKAAASGTPAAAAWDGKSPYSCGGSDNVHIEGVKAKLKTGTAINAGGNCHLELVDVDIEAPTAIQVGANAVVVVKGGTITGTDEAASALGNGKITFSGTKVTGKKSALGAAKIEGP